MDVGTKFIGVALSDPGRSLAFPRPPIEVGDGSRLAERIVERAREEDADTIVVGLPLSMDGGESARQRAVERLASRLRELFDGEVVLLDERLTTVEAERRLSATTKSSRARRRKKDSAAAAVLLQAYLDQMAAKTDNGRDGV